MTDRFERFSFSIFEAVRCWHKLAASEMERYGLGGAHAVYLVQLARFPQGITATRLSQICGRDKSDVSRMISVLEKKGLVVRLCAGSNRYRAPICLTEEGTKAAEAVACRADVAVQNAGKGISAEQREIFYSVLGTITENLQMLCKEGLPLA